MSKIDYVIGELKTAVKLLSDKPPGSFVEGSEKAISSKIAKTALADTPIISQGGFDSTKAITIGLTAIPVFIALDNYFDGDAKLLADVNAHDLLIQKAEARVQTALDLKKSASLYPRETDPTFERDLAILKDVKVTSDDLTSKLGKTAPYHSSRTWPIIEEAESVSRNVPVCTDEMIKSVTTEGDLQKRILGHRHSAASKRFVKDWMVNETPPF